MLYGNSATEGRIPLAQYNNSLEANSERFTPAALAAFNIANGEIIMANDNVTSAIQGLADSTGVLVSGGTGYLRGFFSLQGDKLINYTPVTGFDEASAAPIRLLAALEGPRGSLISVRSGAIVIQDIEAALNTKPTRTLIPIKGAIPVLPVAAAWDRPSRALYILDQTQPTTTTRALRLLRIDPAGGGSDVLWTSAGEPVASFPTSFYLQTTAQADLLIAVSFATTSEWTIMSLDGVAKQSGKWLTALAAPSLLNDVHLFGPFTQPTGTAASKGPIGITSLERTKMKLGGCDAPWLKVVVPGAISCGPGWDGVVPTSIAQGICSTTP
jgi:hypothetical protein